MDKIEVTINGEKHLFVEEPDSGAVQCYNCSLHHLCETGSENLTALCVLLSRKLNCRFILKEEKSHQWTDIRLKAKAYDDARERMSYAYNQNRVPIGFVNEIFPDLNLYKNNLASHKENQQKTND